MDLTSGEGQTDTYVCRLLPLTRLAPDIAEAIVDGRQPKRLRLAEMLGHGPLSWKEQRVNWGPHCRHELHRGHWEHPAGEVLRCG